MLYIKLNNIMKHFEVISGSYINYEGQHLYMQEWRIDFDIFLEKHRDYRIWVNSFGPGWVKAIVIKDVNNFMHLLGA